MKRRVPFFLAASALLSFSASVVSCDNNIIQPGNKNIVSISVKEGTIPEEIFIGEFDQAGIKLIVIYSDETQDEVDVTTALVHEKYQECLTKPGEYSIELLFRGHKTTIDVKMVMPHYAVNFYAYVDKAEYELIESQDVMIHTNVVAPEIELELYYEGMHYTFSDWDKEFYDVAETIDVYAQYDSIEFYVVTFFNGNNEPISVQKVDKNDDAIEPSEELRAMEGYEFMGWDRSYLNVTQRLDIYGLYSKITQTASVESPYIFQADEITDEYYTMTLNSAKTGYIVSMVIKTEEEMVIPSTYKGLPVLELKQNLFNSLTGVLSVEIGYNVEKINTGCFADNNDLTRVVVPNSLKEVDGWVFTNSPSLVFNEYDNAYYVGNKYNPFLVLVIAKSKSITTCNINKGCKFIGNDAFQSTNIKELIVPNSVQKMYNGSLSYCNNLEYVKFSDSMKRIENTLMYCSGGKQKTIVFPENLEVICCLSFHCANLKEINLPNSVKTIEAGAFVRNDNLTEVVFPEGLENIMDGAFGDEYVLNTITLPSTIKTLKKEAFNRCPLLTTINFAGTVEEWNAKGFSLDWLYEVPATEITCSNGVIPIE